jgi:hypothetical protein
MEEIEQFLNWVAQLLIAEPKPHLHLVEVEFNNFDASSRLP